MCIESLSLLQAKFDEMEKSVANPDVGSHQLTMGIVYYIGLSGKRNTV